LADRLLRRNDRSGIGLSVDGLSLAAQNGGGSMSILEWLFALIAIPFLIFGGLIVLVVYLVGAIVFTALMIVYAMIKWIVDFFALFWE
jgi:VIT1/CCC1 family predicted Fe2+/Mn2+ transporter